MVEYPQNTVFPVALTVDDPNKPYMFAVFERMVLILMIGRS